MITNIKKCICDIAFLLFLVLVSNQALAAKWAIDVGPFAGTGERTSSKTIRHISGLSLGVSRAIPIIARVTVAPRMGFTNSYVSTRQIVDNKNSIMSYDNRIFSVGGILTYQVALESAWHIYMSASTGVGTSKLDIDESSPVSFSQTHNRGIPGRYRSLEVGTIVSVSEKDLGLSISIGRSAYELDQSQVVGDMEGEYRSKSGGILLITGRVDANEQGLAQKLSQQITSFKVGIVLGI